MPVASSLPSTSCDNQGCLQMLPCVPCGDRIAPSWEPLGQTMRLRYHPHPFSSLVTGFSWFWDLAPIPPRDTPARICFSISCSSGQDSPSPCTISSFLEYVNVDDLATLRKLFPWVTPSSPHLCLSIIAHLSGGFASFSPKSSHVHHPSHSYCISLSHPLRNLAQCWIIDPTTGVFRMFKSDHVTPPLKATQEPCCCTQNKSQTPSHSLPNPVWAGLPASLPELTSHLLHLSHWITTRGPASCSLDMLTLVLLPGLGTGEDSSFEQSLSRFSLIGSCLSLSLNVTSTERVLSNLHYKVTPQLVSTAPPV